MVLVGDPDQSLYEWRDATPEYFKNKIWLILNDGTEIIETTDCFNNFKRNLFQNYKKNKEIYVRSIQFAGKLWILPSSEYKLNSGKYTSITSTKILHSLE